MITAKVIEDSMSADGSRLTTLQLAYPRFVHSEFMTHRLFSRNASSSRAIPVKKMIEQVRTSPALPVHWGANQPGMQAKAELTGDSLVEAKTAWYEAAKQAANLAEYMGKLGLHKQVANRILEPFQTIHVIVTASEWGNFFELRDHADAQPEILALAGVMRVAMRMSEPARRGDGAWHTPNWHLPYITAEERSFYREDPRHLAKLSAARCARVSYLTHDGEKPDHEKDLALYESLVGSRPLHASPIEHQAYADRKFKGSSFVTADWMYPSLHGNFVGWVQYRKLVEVAMQEAA